MKLKFYNGALPAIVSAMLFLLSPAAAVAGERCQDGGTAASPESIIPLPARIVHSEGTFYLPENAVFTIDLCKNFIVDGRIVTDGAEEYDALESYIEASPLKLRTNAVNRNPGRGMKKDVMKPLLRVLVDAAGDGTDNAASGDSRCIDEGYILEITPKGIFIKSRTAAGAFYAVQSLIQMTRDGSVRRLACCRVEDSPSFGWRGMMVDVSRHFRSVDFLKKQMDAMALFKLNHMHLHLTDAAGWRIQIDAYPELTRTAAWRPQRRWTDWSAAGAEYCHEGDSGAYGGYYTKDDIRELVKYAAERHIELIPEIEMPGHSEEVTAAYPRLYCTGAVGRGDLCPGKEATFEFLQTVLDEVMELFPSQFIHIGGDEAGKGAWHNCPDCAKRMKDNGLQNVEELQSYLIHRIDEYVRSRGRRIIGWDEIMQGGLASGAAVMSWTGEVPGFAAASAGHDVIMTPGAYCYIDYNQDAPFREPLSIGGYTPLEKVYSYNPLEGAPTEEAASHILGVQANLWVEYITEDSHAEYMYYPRVLAVAETGWSRRESKDYADFRTRTLGALELLQARGYTTFDLAHEYGERQASLEPLEHLAKGAAVSYNIPWHSKYPAAGETTLTDGILGGWTYGDRRWQGFLTDMDVTLDLGATKEVHYVGATFMNSPGAWVYLPEQVRISVSDDGENFTPLATVNNESARRDPEFMFVPFAYTGKAQARYIRFQASPYAKDGSWIFVDEIVVL